MSDESSPAAGKRRDRAKTEAAIIAAAKELLAEEGFQGFGINAVARRAGCDKQLLYRYFGGLEGLIEAIGKDIANWIEDSLKVRAEQPLPETYGELMEQLLASFLAALRANGLVQKIAAWEISEPSPLVALLSKSRGEALGRWIARRRGSLVPPPNVDVPATNAFLVAAIQHLVLSASSTSSFSGMSLVTDSDWKRVEDAAVRIVRAVYGGTQLPDRAAVPQF